VSGHDFSRAESLQSVEGFSPCHVETSPSVGPEQRHWATANVFVTTRTAGGKSLFQTDRMANLFIDILRSHIRAKKFKVYDFVVIPNHVHILLTIPGDLSIEKAMQLIKGGFSFRAKKELGFPGEVWQGGFSDVRITDEQSFRHHREYIESNPVRAGLANSAEEYPYGFVFLKKQKCAGAKAQN